MSSIHKIAYHPIVPQLQFSVHTAVHLATASINIALSAAAGSSLGAWRDLVRQSPLCTPSEELWECLNLKAASAYLSGILQRMLCTLKQLTAQVHSTKRRKGTNQCLSDRLYCDEGIPVLTLQTTLMAPCQETGLPSCLLFVCYNVQQKCSK